MKLPIYAGTANRKQRIRITNSATGAGLTGLTYATSGLTAYYFRDGDTSSTSIPLVTASLGTYTSGGFIAVDATNMPGVYEVGIPNTAFSLAGSVQVVFRGAANMADCCLEYDMTATNDQVDPLAQPVVARIFPYGTSVSVSGATSPAVTGVLNNQQIGGFTAQNPFVFSNGSGYLVGGNNGWNEWDL